MYEIPMYMNSHTLQKTDISGNHATTFERNPKPNPDFHGKTIHDLLVYANSDMFMDRYMNNYMYDGDTVEFMTQNFYKTTVKQTINELVSEKTMYINALNKAFAKLNLYQELGPLHYPKRNEPFVCFLTNANNIAIFNNGTYHLNFTMPTQLDGNKKPQNSKQFVSQHKAAIRYIQYLEPLIIAIYGTPDPFSSVAPFYSKASQRCAVSRYIGIGTYNTEEMQTGKILSVDLTDCPGSKFPYWWYTQYTQETHYIPLTKIGVDINFNKHGTHGIEIRFLDWFPESLLEDLMNTLVHVLDYSLKYGCPDDPTICPIWNSLVVKMLKKGPDVEMDDETYDMYTRVFNLPKKSNRFFDCLSKRKPKPVHTLRSVYVLISKRLKKVHGVCVKKLIKN
jgi:hypothetical protein